LELARHSRRLQISWLSWWGYRVPVSSITRLMASCFPIGGSLCCYCCMPGIPGWCCSLAMDLICFPLWCSCCLSFCSYPICLSSPFIEEIGEFGEWYAVGDLMGSLCCAFPTIWWIICGWAGILQLICGFCCGYVPCIPILSSEPLKYLLTAFFSCLPFF